MEPGIRFHPLYVLPFIAMGFLVFTYKVRTGKLTGPFWAWLFPKEFYRHRSTLLDTQLFLFGRALVLLKVINRLAVAIFMAALVMVIFKDNALQKPEQLGFWHTAIMTIMLTLISDFCVYWVHRIHHEKNFLWPFHAVHHSAEIMTPMTVYRKHPIYDLFSSIFSGTLIGIAQGLFIAVFYGSVSIATIAGINGAYFLFNFLGSNFRHSHIWISYGKTLEHILISPAQHQIHHSLKPEHHNKNFGEIFAFWDWMFGTLFIPDTEETIEYGIARPDGSGQRIKQPHNNFKEALIVPFKESARALKKNQNKNRDKSKNKNKGQAS